MSGHSKWSTIKRKKGAQDAKRARMFSRLSKEIEIAVREGGGNDIDANPRLRLAVQNAKGVNMPKDRIERAINKADKDPSNFEKETYEGYLQGGVAVFVECLTDNHNRTVGSIRAIFNKFDGNMGTKGELSFIFDPKGVFTVPRNDYDPEEFQLDIIDAGVEDFEVEDEVFVITTSKEDFGNVQKKLDEMGVELENAELKLIPNNTKTLDKNAAAKVLRVIEEFEDNDDVQNVYHNLEINDEVMELMEANG